MIDTATGRVLLDGVHAIPPSLTLAAFRKSPLARGAQSIGVAAAWPRYFVGSHAIFDDAWSVTLEFHERRLEAVSFVLLGRAASKADEAWSTKAARAAKVRHDAWLARKVGPAPYVYSWGAIESDYDPRSVSSSILLRYS